VLPDGSDSATPLDLPDQADGILTTMKLKTRKKQKASGSSQNSTDNNKGIEDEKMQTEEE
jgi:hypothetical protein